MNRIIIDLGEAKSRRDVQEYIARAMNFPEYYGMNLDALHDCLTDISEDTAVGLTMPAGGEALIYMKSIRRVFRDAAEENRHLVVFFGVSTEE